MVVWVCLAFAERAVCSTYVVYIPLDSPIYQELETLNGLGFLQTYLAEVKPISRVEAARLTLEAQRLMSDPENDAGAQPALPLARAMVEELRSELAEEIDWLEHDAEDDQPTMMMPIERVETQYVYSTGERRQFGPDQKSQQLHATEGTPLLPNNDDLPTTNGSNETIRVSGWAGLKGFLTGYGELSIAGPFSHQPAGVAGDTTSRFRLLRGEVVTDFGNTAISFGQHEMFWGNGHFASLSQGNNGRVLPALRVANVHPSTLPGFLRYLGPFRGDSFFGQLDHYRPFTGPGGSKNLFSRPWLSGQVIAFKPLPNFEFGITHVIMFGGNGNDRYGLGGFLGRALGIGTGNAKNGNTNTQAGIFGKFYFPSLRNLIVYQEINGEDNAAKERIFFKLFGSGSIGRALPFLGVSFLGGAYLPRLTSDGLTTARLEYIDTSQEYSFHSDSLYWAYKDRLMGAPIGPDAFQITLEVGRWLSRYTQLNVGYIHSERDPQRNIQGVPVGDTEFSNGISISLMRLPRPLRGFGNILFDMRSYLAIEWVRNLNYVPGSNSTRAVFQLSLGLTRASPPFEWHH